jgi:hypothetical protein
MGPGIVILFWLFVAAIFGGLWLLSLVVFIIGLRKRRPVFSWLGGVPLCGLTLLACLAVSAIAYGVIRSRNPAMVYQDTFHEKPSPDVAAIQSDAWSFADSGHVYLRFRATESTFRRIQPKDVSKVSYAQYREQMPVISGDSPPVWWVPPTEATSEIYLLNSAAGKRKSFAWETTLVTYDKNTGTVQYFYIGID